MNTTSRFYCLFSAPFSFLGKMKEDYNNLIPTIFQEVWNREELKPDEYLKFWVVNPGQRFIVDKDILPLFPALSVIVTPSTGRNHIDIASCEKKNITVHSLLDDRTTLDSISASAEFSFLLLLNTLRRLDFALKEVTDRRWRAREDDLRGFELSGKQVGLVGMGRIGRRLARWVKAFDAEVAYFDPYVNEEKYPTRSLERIFSDSDIVCACCALTDETMGMIDGSLLRRLKKGACFINTSRGEIVKQNDLIAVIGERGDLRVGLDVISGEVTNTHLSSPLLEMHDKGRIVVTPHIAGATFESQTKAARGALNLLERHLSDGKLIRENKNGRVL